jgi:hypothetical protein
MVKNALKGKLWTESKNIAQYAPQEIIRSCRYIAPLISRRIANVFRKRAIAAGTYGNFDPVHGEWVIV